jgi:DNA-binding Xre family transcriptional regulator
MIRCNLSILLAERGMKISKVSKDTGISRTTLTSLSNNNSQGVQFDTLNTLCMYLKISPEQLISFIPINLELLSITHINSSFDIDIMITENTLSKKFKLICDVKPIYMNGEINNFNAIINFYHVEEEQDNLYITKILSLLPTPFFNDFEMILRSKINDILMQLSFQGLNPHFNTLFNWNNIL